MKSMSRVLLINMVMMAAGRVFYFLLGQGGLAVLPFNEPFHNKGSAFHNLIELRRVCATHGEKGEVSFPQ